MSPSLFRGHGLFPEGWAPASRGSVILLFALMSGEGCGSPAQEGSRGWGRHLCGGPGTAAKATFALTHAAQELGIVSILLWTTFLMGAVLLLLHRGAAPVGSLTLMLALNAAAMGVLYDQGPYPLAQVAAFAAGGVAADVLRALLRPDAGRAQAHRLFAFAMPTVLHLGYFLSLIALDGLWWSVHLWLGTAMFSGVIGWLLSYLVLPTREQRMAHGSV